ncbi:tubulin delta chain-like [Branchiostoma floridae x Branchiostoma japonicum]
MSLVTVQLGQCGNQIGGQLFNTVVEDAYGKGGLGCSKKENTLYQDAVLERFFNTEEPSGETRVSCSQQVLPTARAVMVDMEPKVIQQTIQESKKSGKWRYCEKAQFCQKRGSGNNWAHGYGHHGPKARDAVMDIVQREVEKCDRFGGFLSLMSLAGGTGSGVGAYLTECLREEYPHSFLVNQIVWPYGTGEVIVQNFNAALTLSHLYQSADAIIVFENDNLHKICSQLLSIKNISFQDINSVISQELASVLQPAASVDNGRTNSPGELLERLVPDPQYKLLNVRTIPHTSERALAFSSFTWPGLLKHLRQMLIANAGMEEGVDWQVKVHSRDRRLSSADFTSSLANVLFLRGKHCESTDISPFSDPRLYSSWVPRDAAFSVFRQQRPFHHYEKYASLLSNSQAPVGPLDSLVGKAWNMFASRAYVHQYLKYGIAEEDFLDSFATLEQVISNYSNL